MTRKIGARHLALLIAIIIATSYALFVHHLQDESYRNNRSKVERIMQDNQFRNNYPIEVMK